MGLFLNHSVLLTIDGGIKTNGEYVLMVLGQYTGVDHVTVVACLAWIDVDAADYTRRTSLNCNTARLIELVRKDVLIIGKGDDKLDDKLAVSNDNSAACTPVGMLPADAVICARTQYTSRPLQWLNFYLARGDRRHWDDPLHSHWSRQ